MKQTPRGSGYKKSQMSAKIACNHSELIAGHGEETSGQKANWNYHRKKDRRGVEYSRVDWWGVWKSWRQ